MVSICVVRCIPLAKKFSNASKYLTDSQLTSASNSDRFTNSQLIVTDSQLTITYSQLYNIRLRESKSDIIEKRESVRKRERERVVSVVIAKEVKREIRVFK